MKKNNFATITNKDLATITGGVSGGNVYAWLLGESDSIWAGFKDGMNHYNKKKKKK
ncbi:ComC/BlpC family leader-containing pheromone/bacteriocin [Lactiplantibacillus plantarum]